MITVRIPVKNQILLAEKRKAGMADIEKKIKLGNTISKYVEYF